jgi:hypothetical protein
MATKNVIAKRPLRMPRAFTVVSCVLLCPGASVERITSTVYHTFSHRPSPFCGAFCGDSLPLYGHKLTRCEVLFLFVNVRTQR